MLVGGGRQRGTRPGAVNPSRRGSRSSAAMTHNSAVVRVRLGRERGGRGEIGPWGDERGGCRGRRNSWGTKLLGGGGCVPAVRLGFGEIGRKRGRVAEG